MLNPTRLALQAALVEALRQRATDDAALVEQNDSEEPPPPAKADNEDEQ